MSEFNTRIQQKADTQSNFETLNPILLENELAIVFMTDGSIKMKIGDGISSFSQLQYTDNYLVNSINTLSLNKANIESPSFTGTPVAPTASDGTNTNQLATTAFVMNALSSSSGGTEIILSSEQPTGQAIGSFWYKIIE